MKTKYAVLLAISMALNIFFLFLHNSQPTLYDNSIDTPQKYPLLSPTIFREDRSNSIINFNPLRQIVKHYVQNKAPNIGVYFEYLPNGVSIGANEQHAYLQASLVKVPMAMAVLKKVETGEASLSDELEILDQDLDQKFGDLYTKGVGYKISLREVLFSAIANSDNTAYKMLVRVTPTGLDEVFDYLDLPKEREGAEPAVTPKNYSSILKSLFYSSYLSSEYSSLLLEMLTRSLHDNQIRAPIPTDVPVAHKFGVRDQEQIFSDCGIVYIPLRPYLLCVMGQGDKTEVTEHMQTISEMVYKYVDIVNKKK